MKVCQSFPCQNDGVCKSDGISYSCICKNGFYGVNCQLSSITSTLPTLSSSSYTSQLTSSYSTNIQVLTNSTIVTNDLIPTLINLTNFRSKQWNLLYRATRDGFDSNSFHSRCDYKPNTLTIIKTTKSYNNNTMACIFGGFTYQNWSKNPGYLPDNNAFLFSLVNPTNTPARLNVLLNNPNAIFTSTFPRFGGGHDIYISDNSNVNVLSYTRHYTFLLNEKVPTNNIFLGGSPTSNVHFQTTEIEIYTVN